MKTLCLVVALTVLASITASVIVRADPSPVVIYTKAIGDQTKLEVDSHEIPVDWKVVNSFQNTVKPNAWFLFRYLLVTPKQTVVLWAQIEQTLPSQQGDPIVDMRPKIFDMALSDGYLTIVQQYRGDFPYTTIDTMPVSTTTSVDEKNPPRPIEGFKANSTSAPGVFISAGVITGTRKDSTLMVTLISGSQTFVYKLVKDKWVEQPRLQQGNAPPPSDN